MNTLIHADIFFFITAIAVVIFTIVAVIIGIYVIGIVRDMREVSRKLRHAADELEADFEVFRSRVTEEGRKAKYLVDFFLGKFMKKGKPASRSTLYKKEDAKEDAK